MKFRQIVADAAVKDKKNLPSRLSSSKESMWIGGKAPYIFNLGIRYMWVVNFALLLV